MIQIKEGVCRRIDQLRRIARGGQVCWPGRQDHNSLAVEAGRIAVQVTSGGRSSDSKVTQVPRYCEGLILGLIPGKGGEACSEPREDQLPARGLNNCGPEVEPRQV